MKFSSGAGVILGIGGLRVPAGDKNARFEGDIRSKPDNLESVKLFAGLYGLYKVR